MFRQVPANKNYKGSGEQASLKAAVSRLAALALLFLSCHQAVLAEYVYTVGGKRVPRNVYDASREVQQACKYMEANSIELAAARLRKALVYDPGFAYAHANLGLIYARQGKNTEALKHLNLATKQKDCPDSAYSNLATFYQTTGNLDAAIETYEQLRSKSRNDEGEKSLERIDNTLFMLKRERQRRKEREGLESASDYFADVTGKSAAHWSDWHMPLKVFIEPAEPTLAGYKSSFDSLLRKAFLDWEKASSKKIRFRYVNKREESDIECYWTNNPDLLGNDTENGNTTTSIASGALKHAVIALRVKEIDGSFPFTDNAIISTCRHEVGHALGLAGHSSNPDDLMYFSVSLTDEEKKISDRDRNTLDKVYSQAIPLQGEILDILLDSHNLKVIGSITLVLTVSIFCLNLALKSGRSKKNRRKKAS